MNHTEVTENYSVDERAPPVRISGFIKADIPKSDANYRNGVTELLRKTAKTNAYTLAFDAMPIHATHFLRNRTGLLEEVESGYLLRHEWLFGVPAAHPGGGYSGAVTVRSFSVGSYNRVSIHFESVDDRDLALLKLLVELLEWRLSEIRSY